MPEIKEAYQTRQALNALLAKLFVNDDLTGALNEVIKDTKIVNLRFHDLRHEAVSRLVEAGLGDQGHGQAKHLLTVHSAGQVDSTAGAVRATRHPRFVDAVSDRSGWRLRP